MEFLLSKTQGAGISNPAILQRGTAEISISSSGKTSEKMPFSTLIQSRNQRSEERRITTKKMLAVRTLKICKNSAG
jgi:hypothetical protein